MEDTIHDDEIIEAAVKMDDYLLHLVDEGFGVEAINGIVLARLLMLNKETKNEKQFFKFLSELKPNIHVFSGTTTLQ